MAEFNCVSCYCVCFDDYEDFLFVLYQARNAKSAIDGSVDCRGIYHIAYRGLSGANFELRIFKSLNNTNIRIYANATNNTNEFISIISIIRMLLVYLYRELVEGAENLDSKPYPVK